MAAGEDKPSDKPSAEDDKRLLDFCTRINEELIRGMVLNEKIDVTKLVQFKEGSVKLNARHAWAGRLVDCMEVHFQSVNLLRKFQDGRKETEKDMNERLMYIKRQALASLENKDESLDDYWSDVFDAASSNLDWIESQGKAMCKEASTIPKLRQRLQPQNSEQIRVLPLFSIKNKNLLLKKGESLLLINNAESDIWKVQNETTGQVYNAPALMMLMLGPNLDCITVLKDFQQTVSTAIKRTINMVTTDLAQCLKTEFKGMKQTVTPKMQLSMNDRKVVQDSLRTIRRTVDERMKSSSKYQALSTHLHTVEKHIGNASRTYSATQEVEDFRNQISNLASVLEKYEEFVSQAEKLCKVELKMEPDKSSELVNYRRPRPTSNVPGARRIWEITYIMKEIHRKEEVTYVADNTNQPKLEPGDHVGFLAPDGWTHFDEEAESKVATSFQVLRSEGEQTTKFIIDGVIDPRTKEMIGMKEAIAHGILIQEEGMYCDITTGNYTPIPDAMNEGLIVMTVKDVSNSEAPTTSFGMVSVRKTHEGKRSYRINHVVHPITGEIMDHEEAVTAGVMNDMGSVYINPKSGTEIIIAEAIKKKLVYAEIDDEDSSDEESEVNKRHYVISSVVDRRLKRRVSFREATMTGLIDKETGAYIDSVTGQRLYVADAIGRGFMKAKEVDDPTELDIEPENTMYVEKVEQIKKKILRPLKVISMFKKERAAAQARNSTIQEGEENGH